MGSLNDGYVMSRVVPEEEGVPKIIAHTSGSEGRILVPPTRH
jgi:hypothetical protein